jgi:hypothetical protein
MRIDGPQVTSSLSLNGTTITDLNVFVTTGSLNGLTGSYATTGSNLFNGTQTLSGSIIPAVNNTYDLGSPTNQFRHVYISSGSLYVNGVKVLGSTSQELQITTDVGQSFKILESGADTITLQSGDGNVTLTSSGQGDIVLDPTTGVIGLKGTVTIYTGNKIVSSDGNSIQFGNGIAVTGSIVSTTTSLVSGSSQITYSGLSGVPSDIISGSGQLTTLGVATTGSNTFNGNLTVTGFIDTQELRTTYISSSILYRSGSTKFGDELTDTHSFTGSILISGSISVPGSNLVSGSSQILNGSGVFSGSAQLPSGIVSGSAQVISSLPTGTVSGSAQVVSLLPSGTVSGSVQIDVMSTTNIARLATTGSNVFTGALTGTTALFKVSTDRNLAIKYDTNITLSAQADAGGPESLRIFADTYRIFTATSSAGLTERFTISNTGAATLSNSLTVATTGTFGFQDYRTQSTQKVLVLNAEGVSGNYSPSLFNIYTKPGTTVNGIASLIITSKYGSEAESGNLFEFKGNGEAVFSSSVVSSDGYQGRYYRIREASASRGGLYPFNLVAGSGTDYSVGIFSEGEIFLAPGGSATKRFRMTNTGAATFTSDITTNGIFYTTDSGPSIYQNRINAGWNSVGDAIDLWINYEGYQNSTAHFRDFRIGNGKRGGAIVFVDGSEGTTTFSGNLNIIKDQTATTTLLVQNTSDGAGASTEIKLYGNEGVAPLKNAQQISFVRGSGGVDWAIGTPANSNHFVIAGGTNQGDGKPSLDTSTRLRITNDGYLWVNGNISGMDGSAANLQVNGFARIGGQVIFHNSANAAQSVSVSCNGADSFNIAGALSKSSGTFKIDHPLESKKNTHHLVHSFIEGPRVDLIYRGKVTLVNGTAQVNIDNISNMTEGTFEALCREVQCFTTNETGWDLIKGKVIGNIIYIEAQNTSSTDEISWMVMGERKDEHIMNTSWTDNNGKIIIEPLKKINKSYDIY